MKSREENIARAHDLYVANHSVPETVHESNPEIQLQKLDYRLGINKGAAKERKRRILQLSQTT